MDFGEVKMLKHTEHDVIKLWHERYDEWGHTPCSMERWLEDYEAIAVATDDIHAYEEMLGRSCAFHDEMHEEEDWLESDVEDEIYDL